MAIGRVTDVIMEMTTRIDLTELNLTNRKSKLITNVIGRLCGCSWTVAHYDCEHQRHFHGRTAASRHHHRRARASDRRPANIRLDTSGRTAPPNECGWRSPVSAHPSRSLPTADARLQVHR